MPRIAGGNSSPFGSERGGDARPAGATSSSPSDSGTGAPDAPLSPARQSGAVASPGEAAPGGSQAFSLLTRHHRERLQRSEASASDSEEGAPSAPTLRRVRSRLDRAVPGATRVQSVFETRIAHAARKERAIRSMGHDVATGKASVDQIDAGAREDPLFWRALFETPLSADLSLAMLKRAMPETLRQNVPELANMVASSPRALELVDDASELRAEVALAALTLHDASADVVVAPFLAALGGGERLCERLRQKPALLASYPSRTRARVIEQLPAEALASLTRSTEVFVALATAAPEIFTTSAFTRLHDRATLLAIVQRRPDAIGSLSESQRAAFFDTLAHAHDSLTRCPALASCLPASLVGDRDFLEQVVAHEPKVLEHLPDDSASSSDSLGHRARLLSLAVEGPYAYPRDDSGPKLLCPLTGERLENPVLARDGYVYSKDALLSKLSENGGRSPLVPHLELDPASLVPVVALRSLVAQADAGGSISQEAREESLIDPVTLSLLTDPVVDPFGHTFDVATLARVFTTQSTAAKCPNNNEAYPKDSVFIRCRWLVQALREVSIQSPTERIFRFGTREV